ncbi:MAG: hypothetical protein ACFCUI_07580 [Bernardetiaceae bacterium]
MKKYNQKPAHPLDQRFQDALKEHHAAVQPDTWKRVAAQLPPERRKRRFALWVLFALVGIGLWVYHPEQAVVEPETSSEALIEKPATTNGEAITSQQKNNSETLIEKPTRTTNGEAIASQQKNNSETWIEKPITTTEEVIPQKTNEGKDTLLHIIQPVDTIQELAPKLPTPETNTPSIQVEIRLGGSAPASREEEQEEANQQEAKAGKVLKNLWHLSKGDGKVNLNDFISSNKTKK